MTEPRDQHDAVQDQELRQLFADATAEVRPQGSLEDILNRSTKVDPMTRRWFLPVIAAAVVIGLAIGGAVWLAGDDSPTSTPPPLGGPSDGAGEVDATVPVYFVGDGARDKRLFREFRRTQICAAEGCLLTASARAAVAGAPEDADYVNPWPDGSALTSATYDGDVLTVDLHLTWLAQDGSGPDVGPEQALAVQQLIYSAQAGLGKGRVPVQLLVDGAKVPKILGVDTEAPLQAADPDSTLALVQVSSPGDGATVPAGDLKVNGVANAFEANVVWELLVGGDAVVKSGHATAAECCTLAPYAFTIKDVQPGSYTLVVHDEDMSGEGRAVNQDTKEIVVE